MVKNISKLDFKDLMIFLIPVVIFSFYLYVYNPGILRYDSFNQFHQIATKTYYNWHPFFHTFIEKVLLKIYPNPIIISIFQILTFSSIWTVICNYYRRNIEGNKVFFIQAIITLVIALIPINALFSIMLLKDILFSYLLLFLCFLIAVLIDKKGKVGYGFIFIMALTMAFVSGLRPNGIIIVIITLIFLAVYLFKRNFTKKIIAVVALTFIFLLLISSLNVVFDVDSDVQKDPVLAKVSHMLADYDLNLDLEKADRDKIHQLINESTIKEKYSITYSDPICFASDNDAWDNDKFTYIWIAIKYSIKNPLRCFDYLFNSSPMVWNIIRDDSWVGYQYNTDMAADKAKFFSFHKGYTMTKFEDISYKNNGTAMFDMVDAFVNDFKDNTVLDTLFDSPALYMYIALVLLVSIYLITKSKVIFLVYVPNMLNILIIFASTPIQDYRYLYPNLLVCYFLIIMLASVLTKKSAKDI